MFSRWFGKREVVPASSPPAPLEPIEFDIRTPLDAERIGKHIAHARSLLLPEADSDPIETLHIVANGPSAAGAPRITFGKTVLAVNGALQLFEEAGVWPDYWAGCDPQEHLADFLTDPPAETTYLIASKCHPTVFEALKDRTVKVWHIDDHDCGPYVRRVGTAVSVTLTAMSLMARLGWRRFEVWGWDGCYLDGQDHASPQTHARDNDVTVEIGDRLFKSTGTWAAEAKDAAHQLSIFDWFGIEVIIHGDGMIRAFVDAHLTRV